MNDIIKLGMRFVNGFMECTVIGYTEVNGKNLALLLCSNDGLFITVRNLQLWQGQYIWYFGHYYSSLNEAIRDYNERKKDL
jgi:hypothetical protein